MRSLLASFFLSALAACGAGTAAVVAAAGSGGSPGSANSPTQVALVGVRSPRETPALIDFLLTDAESDSATVDVRFSPTTTATVARSPSV